VGDGAGQKPPEFSGLLVLWLVVIGFAALAVYGGSWILGLVSLVGIAIAARWSFVKWRAVNRDR
jgi:hypothetical protein